MFAALFPSTLHAQSTPDDEIMFVDDFNDGDFDGWSVESGSWFINQLSLLGLKNGIDFSGRISVGDLTWSDYEVEMDILVGDGTDEGIGFRRESPLRTYELVLKHFPGTTSSKFLLNKHYDNQSLTLDSSTDFYMPYAKWHHLKLSVEGEKLRFG